MTCEIQPGEIQIGNNYYSCPTGYELNTQDLMCYKTTSTNIKEFSLISLAVQSRPSISLLKISELDAYRIYLVEIKENTITAIKYGQTEREHRKNKWCEVFISYDPSVYVLNDPNKAGTINYSYSMLIDLESLKLNNLWNSKMIATYELLADITDPCIDDAETQPYWSIVPEYNIMIKIDPDQPIKGEPLKEYIKTASANAIADVYRIKSTEIDSVCVITKIDSITVLVPRIPEDATLESISIYGELN